MRGYIANTDYDWFTYLRSVEPPIDEVNFWRPGSDAVFRALDPGEPFFFRLKAPRGAIGGHGFFVHFSKLPVSVAWETFGQANGAATYGEMRDRLLGIRKRFNMDADPKRDFHIGCILINQPVFFDDGDLVRSPTDFTGPIVGGKTYDLDSGEGERIWLECRARAAPRSVLDVIGDRPLPGGYGPPSLVRQRLGQRSFRVVVLDSYERRCAVTNERTIPALEAAHIRDYRDVQEHSINNGILFRADIHKLFDTGYVTVTPDHHFEVSKRIKEEFENGRDYYKLHGTSIRLPHDRSDYPAAEALTWHNEQRYLG
ncbi:MAG TPA: HNH endonuclease [Thermoanaerobaculia bacterium]|nr:HNH endonuclease [Thermoanaerobaculia bacterium]